MVSEELCVTAAMTMVILSVGRRQQLLTAKHQTDNQSDSLYGRHLLSVTNRVRNLEIGHHGKRDVPPVPSPLTMTSGEIGSEQSLQRKERDPFLATGGSSGVGQWTHDCIRCCGYRTNQPRLAAPRNHSCFIFLVPGSGSTWALVHDFSSGSPLKLPIRWGLCLPHPERVSTPTFSC